MASQHRQRSIVACLQDKNVSLTEANAQLDAKLHEAQAAHSRAQLTQARCGAGGWGWGTGCRAGLLGVLCLWCIIVGAASPLAVQASIPFGAGHASNGLLH